MVAGNVVAYYVVTLLGIISSLFVTASIAKAGLRTISSKLLVYFHVTLLLDIVSFFPYVYARLSPTLCSFMAWLHYYSGLGNAVVTFLMILYYRNLLLTDKWARFAFKVKWRMEIIIVSIPLITLLPLITNAYGEVHNEWCDMEVDSTEGILWTIFAYYIWIFILVIIGTIMFTRTILRVYQLDTELALNVVSTIGMYCILSIVSLILRVVTRKLFGSYASIGYSVSAFGYFLIFLRERKALVLFEMFKQQQDDDGSSIISRTYESEASLDSNFSWDIDETRLSFSYGKEGGGGLLSISTGGSTGVGNSATKGKNPNLRLQRLSTDAKEGIRPGFATAPVKDSSSSSSSSYSSTRLSYIDGGDPGSTDIRSDASAKNTNKNGAINSFNPLHDQLL